MSAEETVVGLSGLLRFELQCSELDCANEIGRLRKTVIFRASILVHNRVSGKSVLHGVVQSLGHDVLPVVIVDFDLVEPLQISKIVEDEIHDVASNSRSKGGVVGKLVFPV